MYAPYKPTQKIDLVERMTHIWIDTILPNPYKTKIIAEAKIKSDKLY
jgi:hypothetical protein